MPMVPMLLQHDAGMNRSDTAEEEEDGRREKGSGREADGDQDEKRKQHRGEWYRHTPATGVPYGAYATVLYGTVRYSTVRYDTARPAW